MDLSAFGFDIAEGERLVSTRGLWDIREQGGQRKYCGGQVKVGELGVLGLL